MGDSDLVIYNYADVSTGHISKEDVDLLNSSDYPGVVFDYEYGWWVHVYLDASEFEESIGRLVAAGLSEGFIAIQRQACAQGCWFIRLDADAEIYPDLPMWPWQASTTGGK